MDKLKGGELILKGYQNIDTNWFDYRMELIESYYKENNMKIDKQEIYEASCKSAEIERQALVYTNQLFTILCYRGEGADDLVHLPMLKGKCAYLSILRNDRKSNIYWHEKMNMVQIILGHDWFGVELYPPYKFMVDTANQYHIICIPPEFTDDFPFGWKHREINTENSKGGNGRAGQTFRGTK